MPLVAKRRDETLLPRNGNALVAAKVGEHIHHEVEMISGGVTLAHATKERSFEYVGPYTEPRGAHASLRDAAVLALHLVRVADGDASEAFCHGIFFGRGPLGVDFLDVDDLPICCGKHGRAARNEEVDGVLVGTHVGGGTLVAQHAPELVELVGRDVHAKLARVGHIGPTPSPGSAEKRVHGDGETKGECHIPPE